MIIITIDLNLTITGIIALVALLSPIITAIINNRYELKKFQLQNSSEQKREALKSFINCTLNYYGSSSSFNSMCRFTDAKDSLVLYFNSIDENLFKELDDYRSKNKLEEYKETLNKIVKKLANQIEK